MLGDNPYCFTVSDVKAKIKNIRTVYTREKTKTKKKKTGQGLDEVYVSKYPHFDQLRFLDDFVTAKSSITNIKGARYSLINYS